MQRFHLTIGLCVLAITSACGSPATNTPPVAISPTATPSVTAQPKVTAPSPEPTPTLQPLTPKQSTQPATSTAKPPVRRAILTSENLKSRINVRAEPSRNANAKHYGFAGDPVDVLDESRSKDDDGLWYQVKFVQSGAMGWISAAYVDLGAATPAPIVGGATQKAVLTSENPKSRINVREDATRNAKIVHRGYAGDAVLVMRETRSTDDNGMWYLVQYNEAGATGWVSASYVSINN